MNKALKDHGPKPFVVDVEKLTVDNKNYRTVIWTGKYVQMTVMSIPPGEDIGLEIHKDHDQFIRIEEGEGIVQMGDAEDNLDFQEKVGDDFAVLIPAGKWHNLVNNSTEPLKLYSIYSPVEHPKNTVHKTKQDEITKHYNGGKLNNHTNMKYNKDKQKNLKKFATGGKTPAQIMEEARRNQAIERSQATTDVVRNSGIPAFQSQQVAINVPRQARKAGLKEFTWLGDRFNTDLEDTSQTTKTNTSAVNNSTANAPLSEEQIRRNATIRERGTEGLEISNNPYNEWTPPTLVLTGLASNPNPNKGDVPQSALQSKTTQSKNPNFMERGLFGWAWDNLRRVDQQNRAAQIENKRIWDEKYAKHQQGGQLLSYQQGGQLPLRSNLERFFRVEPRYQSVNPNSTTPVESTTDYMENTLRGPRRVSRIRKPVEYGSGYLTSTRVIRNPWTDKADTTYVAPSGDRFNQFEATKTPSLQSYPNKFGQYFKYQQGGKVESPSDEMYVDFAVRYLSALGVGETEMVDEEGGLREEYAEAVTVALQEVDSPEFWEHYHSNPDEAVGAYVESKQSPEQVEMAKKGAKLKMLKKAKGGKVKKCKCGCGMTMKKEKGGKLTEVCSCGCKN